MQGSAIIDPEQFIPVDAPSASSPVGDDGTLKLKLASDVGSYQMKSMFHPYFSFHQVDADFKYNATMKPAERPKKHIGLVFLSEGRSSATFGDQHEVNVISGHGSFSFIPGMSESYRFFQGKPIQANYLDIDAEYFNQALAQDGIENINIDLLREKICNNAFVNNIFTVTAAHYRVMSDIVNCSLQGSLRNLMLEGSLLQLIALQLQSLGDINTDRETLNSREKEAMHAVKEYLGNTFHHDHSLLNLSREFGINQSKLQKNFKALFGIPVIEYVFNLKMQYAHMLLCDKGMYVAEVAPLVGYRNANHFATAFKRKFGVSPSRLRG